MAVLSFILLFFCYWLSGYGILVLFRMRLKPAYMFTLSILLGIAVASFIPFLLQLFYIVITGPTVFGALAVTALLLNIPSLRKQNKWSLSFRRLRPASFRVSTYEIPWILILGFLIFVSAWRCYYWPPTSRDALSGPETIAEFAVREQTMINSFFQIDLWSTNNQFKSPFLIGLQIIYKLAGFPFGQVWLTLVFICFTVFLYHALRETLHPVIAGLLLLLFVMEPEIYAYSFMILYDYSNMVFYFLGLYFLFRSFAAPAAGSGVVAGSAGLGPAAAPAAAGSHSVSPRMLSFAGLLLGIATYIRSETLVLVLLLFPLLLFVQLRPDGRFRMPPAPTLKKLALNDLFFLLPSLVGYYLPGPFYINHYLPVHYDIGALVNEHPANLGPLFQRYSDIVSKLLFGSFSIHLWGYIFYVATALFLAELIFVRKFNKTARNWLYAIVVLYLALGALGFALPMFNLLETTKRALFKMMPLILFYLANNELLIRLSRRMSGWETAPGVGSGSPAPVLAAPAPGPASSPAGAKKKKKKR